MGTTSTPATSLARVSQLATCAVSVLIGLHGWLHSIIQKGGDANAYGD
ncbi:hypothetical protein LCGC14_0312700 [marine sediment metagenome]|uniref:Uncharacterized protein n=1 Tax=marine sediment metagenome TaxID=412755 RepID=A0A0F9WT51_9ZZZZ